VDPIMEMVLSDFDINLEDWLLLPCFLSILFLIFYRR
jgi:hypothetical protein